MNALEMKCLSLFGMSLMDRVRNEEERRAGMEGVSE